MHNIVANVNSPALTCWKCKTESHIESTGLWMSCYALYEYMCGSFFFAAVENIKPVSRM